MQEGLGTSGAVLALRGFSKLWVLDQLHGIHK